jgi:hypothetical protein
MRKVWISKYALSNGVTEHECELCDADKGYVYPGKPFAAFYSFKLGTDAHLSLEDALAAAERARIKKIAMLRKQIHKLEELSFVIDSKSIPKKST